VIDECLDLGRSELTRMAFPVEEDVLPNPVAIALLGSRAQMTTAANGGEQVEQARGITP
jgi:hypothetical protein